MLFIVMLTRGKLMREQITQRLATPILTVGLIFLLVGVFSLSQAASLIAPAIDQINKISVELKNTKESVDKLTTAVMQLQKQLAATPK
jgi:NADH:ubiquinone oxidoreductase subunit 6 (subunit J)